MPVSLKAALRPDSAFSRRWDALLGGSWHQDMRGRWWWKRVADPLRDKWFKRSPLLDILKKQRKRTPAWSPQVEAHNASVGGF